MVLDGFPFPGYDEILVGDPGAKKVLFSFTFCGFFGGAFLSFRGLSSPLFLLVIRLFSVCS